jgi:hypothetical protein
MTAFVALACRFRPGEVAEIVRGMAGVPVRDVLPICEEFGIVDATLFLCELSKDMGRAREVGFRELEQALFRGEAMPVCEQIFSFFVDKKDGKTELWEHFLGAFALPLFAAMEDQKKLGVVVDVLRIFLKKMIGDVESAKTVARAFADQFAFVPFRIARLLIFDIFRAIREKVEFAGALADVVRAEAVDAQAARMRELAAGVKCDAVRCPRCGKMLGQGAAVAAGCGHVFHKACATERHCEKCNADFAEPQLRAAPRPSSKKEGMESRQPPKPLQPPGIGVGFKTFKTGV